MNSAVVLYSKGSIQLWKLHEYAILHAEVLKRRSTYASTLKGVITTVNLYISEDSDLSLRIKSVKSDIRLFTKGTSTSYDLEYASAITDSLYMKENTSQLYNANSILLKSAYKKLMHFVHPDKGGKREDYDAVNTAYKNKDLVYLQEFYINLVNYNDLFWRQSEGIAYCIQELERPVVSLTRLKNNPLFNVARLHYVGKKDLAMQQMELFQQNLLLELTNELTYLQTKKDIHGY